MIISQQKNTVIQRVASDLGSENASLPRGSKTICLPCDEAEYMQAFENLDDFRKLLDDRVEKHPELFPKDIAQGYIFHGYTDVSVKEGIRLRRIKIQATGEVFAIALHFC